MTIEEKRVWTQRHAHCDHAEGYCCVQVDEDIWESAKKMAAERAAALVALEEGW